MPKTVETRKNSIQNIDSLKALRSSLDEANIFPAHMPDGAETHFQIVQNMNTGDLVSSMGGSYELVQHEAVVGGLVDSLEDQNIAVTGGFIAQTPARFRALVTFDREIHVGTDPSPYTVGAIIRNSLDGSSSVEASLFLLRGYCQNGMVFGRQDLLGGKLAHKDGVNDRLEAGFFQYFSNLDGILAPWAQKLEAAQGQSLTPEQLEAAVKGCAFGKKLEAAILSHVPKYADELGWNAYTAYQAATDAISHYRNTQGNPLSEAAQDKHWKTAEKLLVYKPKKTAAV